MIGTLSDLFYRAVDRFDIPDRLLVKRDDRWRKISTKELLTAVEETALGLRGLGLQRGDFLALLAENRPEWAVVDWAALALGATVVPIYTTLPASQVRFILKDSEARMLVVSNAAHLERVQGALQGTSVVQIVVIDDEPSSEHLSLSRLRRRGAVALAREPDAVRREARRTQPEDVATLIYTAGTTGEPKGVLLTHANLVFNVLACQKAFPHLGPTDVTLSFLPLSHVFERTGGHFLMFHAGVTIAYAEGPDRIADNLLEVRPTVLYGVPRLFEKIHGRVRDKLAGASLLRRLLVRVALAIGRVRFQARLSSRRLGVILSACDSIARRLVLSRLGDALGGRLHTIVSGGAALAEEILRFFGAAGLVIQEGYGLTETSPVVSVNPRERIKPASVGRPLDGVEVRIAADGEILVRGPLVMKGYHGKPRETSEVVDAEGWFHTGDLGALDADGYLFVTGRIKDLIVTAGGKKIAPQPIEDLLKRDPLFEEVVMVGNRRHFASALVFPDFEKLEKWASGRGLAWSTRQELVRLPPVVELFERRVAEMTLHLAPFETIKKILLLPGALAIETGELTPKLSLRRHVIEERHRAVLDSIYAEAERRRSESS